MNTLRTQNSLRTIHTQNQLELAEKKLREANVHLRDAQRALANIVVQTGNYSIHGLMNDIVKAQKVVEKGANEAKAYMPNPTPNDPREKQRQRELAHDAWFKAAMMLLDPPDHPGWIDG